jgi:hypothetical protein
MLEACLSRYIFFFVVILFGHALAAVFGYLTSFFMIFRIGTLESPELVFFFFSCILVIHKVGLFVAMMALWKSCKSTSATIRLATGSSSS